MRCDDAAEFVSAMADDEAVPTEAAQHIAGCGACQELLKTYAEMGAEIRGLGSLTLAEPLRERSWTRNWVQPQRSAGTWWEKGWTMMRVPRIAFASLVLLLAVVGSRLAMVEVRAHEDGAVLLLKLTPAQGTPIDCSLALNDPKHDRCGGLTQIEKNNLLFSIQPIRKEGERVQLSVRSRVDPIGPASFGPQTAASLPETQIWFTPGHPVALPNTGELNLVLSGIWSDHVPASPNANALLDPGANEIRLTSPLLLKANRVVGDMAYASSGSDKAEEGVEWYIPGEGRFLLSATPITGAVRGEVNANRVSFESDGQKYVLVTGMPITRAQNLWVLHDAAYKPEGVSDQEPFVAAGLVTKLL